MNPRLKGSLAATGALTAVGSLVAAADVIAHYPVAAGQALRYALAGALLAALARGRLPRPTARELVLLCALAATGLVLFNVFVIGAVREGDPGTVGVIVGCVPVVLAFAAPLLDGRPPSPGLVAAAVIVALGAAGVEQVGGGLSRVGMVLAIGALGCEACFSLIAVPILERLGAVAVSAYSCLIAVPMFTVWALIADGPSLPAPTIDEVAALAYLGSIVTVGGFVLWYSSIALLGVERAALFSGVLPISAVVCAAVVGAGEITPERVAAMAVVLLGITAGMRVAPVSRSATSDHTVSRSTSAGSSSRLVRAGAHRGSAGDPSRRRPRSRAAAPAADRSRR